MVKDISNFNNINDYLPILNGCLIADIIIILITFYTPYFSDKLADWYKKYQLSAVIADTLILVIGFILARIFYKKIFKKWSLLRFIFLILVIQIIHDILFYVGIIKPMPKGANRMIDLFKTYANQTGITAILGDSFMMVISVLLAVLCNKVDTNYNIIILIISLYLLPYIIHAKE